VEVCPTVLICFFERITCGLCTRFSHVGNGSVGWRQGLDFLSDNLQVYMHPEDGGDKFL
jgi:hypothetical protein